jgi:hypothetical protein
VIAGDVALVKVTIMLLAFYLYPTRQLCARSFWGDKGKLAKQVASFVG